MTECLPENLQGVDKGESRDDLVQILQVLHNTKGTLENAFLQWQETYKDVSGIDGIEELNLKNPLFETVEDWDMSLGDADNVSLTSLGKDSLQSTESGLRRRTSSRISVNKGSDETSPDNCYQAWKQDKYFSTDMMESSFSETEDQYFEVTSSNNHEAELNSSSMSLRSLVDSLKKSREIVQSKCNEIESVVDNVSKAATESCTHHEKVGMIHRSLTLLEMRQEKAMRESLYDNITSNSYVRRLHDENIQLRIRDTQHQNDLQRLMAENARLKLKLMEARSYIPSNKTATSQLHTKSSDPIEKAPAQYVPAPMQAAGLLEIDSLHKPVCEGAVQRGCLSSYKDDTRLAWHPSSDEISIQESQFRKMEKCPLCNRRKRDNSFDSMDEEFETEPKTRSIGTSTADIENIVALRRTICVLGLYLPIPLFIACVLRTIEESMMMIGRVCFAELPPFDPSFPELQGDIMDALRQMHRRVKARLRQ